MSHTPLTISHTNFHTVRVNQNITINIIIICNSVTVTVSQTILSLSCNLQNKRTSSKFQSSFSTVNTIKTHKTAKKQNLRTETYSAYLMFCFVVSFNLYMFGSCVRMLAVVLVLDLFLTSRAEHHQSSHLQLYRSLPEFTTSVFN